ncbi:MAG: hypothetical protein IPK12_20450 [Gemmatimonadetes bacterium]|nr:hypothetical protein [Gemmatimonadota bacterium]
MDGVRPGSSRTAGPSATSSSPAGRHGPAGPAGLHTGLRGLTPNPKAGTVTLDVARAVREIKVRHDRVPGGQDWQRPRPPVGKINFSEQQLAENPQAFMGPSSAGPLTAAKGQYISSATVSSTMGPGVRADTAVYR